MVRSPYAAKHYNDAPPYHDRGAVGNAGDRWSFDDPMKPDETRPDEKIKPDEKSIYFVQLYSWKDCEEII